MTAAPARPADGPGRSVLLRRVALHAAALAALLGVFALYAQPDFLAMLADQLWSCS